MIREQQEFERKFGKILDAEAVKTKQEAEAFFEEKQKVLFLIASILLGILNIVVIVVVLLFLILGQTLVFCGLI